MNHPEEDEEVSEDIEQEIEIDEDSMVLARDLLPDTLAIIPLRPRPAFPAILIPLSISGSEKADIIRHAVESESKTIGLVLVKDVDGKDEPGNLHKIGVVGKIVKVINSEDDSIQVLVNCLERFTLGELHATKHGLYAQVEYHLEKPLAKHQELKAYSMAVISTLKELVQINPLYSEEIKMFLGRSSMDDPGRLADFAANLTSADGQELQQVLATINVRQRIEQVLVLLKKELEVSRIQSKISKQIEKNISAQQRQFFLKEQLKTIKKELGLEKEGKVSEIEKFQQRLKGLTLNEETQHAVDEEIEKLQLIEPASPEYNVSRNYLDWLTVLPWGKTTTDSYDIAKAKRALDRDHYGLDDVKERILEFIAVGKMKGEISGSILCLVGPPGTGKTSIGKSVAAALKRNFFRFSLGGMRDEAEIKGHRRTYIGAMPGKVIQAMKQAASSNPVLMLDEIDKIGASFQGDPASALLEVLDPEQNNAFRDHYLDVPFDLSNVLFIATANQLDTIPPPLLDRMEIIRLSGYILAEKVEIAQRYIIPKVLKNHGLNKKQVSIRKDALETIIDSYAREAGVRGLENHIKKIMRKAAMQFASGREEKISVRKANLTEYLGKAVFSRDELFKNTPGITTGLAWTTMGGVTLQIESTAMPSTSKGFKQTGQLGNVMVESSEIAYSYLMGHLKEYHLPEKFFDSHFVHLHVPAGATPKDGPSAGITMATALLSMISGKAPRKHLGMTGELSLTGQVLPIGGLKEKTIAARRSGLKVLIFPEGNRKDFEELPAHLKEGLEVHFAKTYRDVYNVAFTLPTTK